MPNQPSTPLRTVRVAPEVWDAAKERATLNDETVSDVIRRALVEYVMLPPLSTAPGQKSTNSAK